MIATDMERQPQRERDKHLFVANVVFVAVEQPESLQNFFGSFRPKFFIVFFLNLAIFNTYNDMPKFEMTGFPLR